MVFVFLLLLLSGGARAQSGGVVEARLLSKSSTGKTVLLNVGAWESVNTGDFAVLMRRVGPGDGKGMQVVPVAKGRVLKASRNRSVWMLYKVFDAAQLVLRDPYLVATESSTMSGRRDLESDRARLVDERAQMAATANSKQRGDRDHLAVKGADYRVLDEMHPLDERYEKDGTLHDLDAWVTVGSKGQEKYARALWRSPHEDEFARTQRLETFEKIVVNYLRRVNEPGFNYATFYASAPDGSGMPAKNTFRSEYMAFLENREENRAQDAEFHREILKKGDSWSAQYSDEELARLMSRVGGLQERERREAALVVARSWQSSGSFGLNLLDNENRADAEGARKAKWNVELMGEWFPAPRHATAERLGIWGGVRYVEDGVSIGSLNAQATETSLALGAAWHPFRSPFTVGQNIPFVGVGVRSGVSRLQVASTGEKGNYALFSAPALVAGVKYHFTSGWGLRVAGSVEKLLLEQTGTTRLDGDLPGRTEILDGRLSIGLTKFH